MATKVNNLLLAFVINKAKGSNNTVIGNNSGIKKPFYFKVKRFF